MDIKFHTKLFVSAQRKLHVFILSLRIVTITIIRLIIINNNYTQKQTYSLYVSRKKFLLRFSLPFYFTFTLPARNG